jgi:hypothetical protein
LHEVVLPQGFIDMHRAYAVMHFMHPYAWIGFREPFQQLYRCFKSAAYLGAKTKIRWQIDVHYGTDDARVFQDVAPLVAEGFFRTSRL